MRNLKKVLALVVAVAMLASFGFVASAASYSDVASNANYADAVNLLSNLGIIKGYDDGTFKPDNTVTRAEAATMMVRVLGLADDVEQGETEFTDVPADHWASGFINVAYAQGIILGMGDGTFNPEGEVTYGQIVKMIVCAIGYEPVAVSNGGWNGGGYIYAGSKAGFTKGVSGTANAAASRATVARLIYNALDVKMMDQTSYSNGINGGTWEVTNDTILSKYLELEEVEGVIVETYLSSAEYVEGDNTIELVVTKNNSNDVTPNYEVGDTLTLVADGTSAATLLGYTVVAYVGENEDGDDAIFAVAEKAGKNSKIVLDTELIESFNGEFITYYKSESARSTTEAEVQAVVEIKNNDVDGINNMVVNGFNVNYALVDSLVSGYESLDELTFLDNDNDGDFEFVFATVPSEEDAVEFVVESVDYDEWIIEGEDDSFALDYDDEDKLYTIVKDGVIVNLDAVVEGDVITVLDAEVNVITVNVSSVVIEGTVDEVDDDVYTIAGNAYELSPITFTDEDSLSAGDEGLFYVNASGKIAYVDTVNSIVSADYVYVIDADLSEGDFGDDEYLVKVVTASGAIEVLTIKSKKVDVYGDGVEDEDITDEEAYAYLEDYEGIAKIDTTTAGEVSVIYFPGAEDFIADDRYENDDENETKSYNEVRGTYGSVDLTSNTIVFHKDSSEEDLEDAITVSTVGNLFVDGSSYGFVAYGAEDEAADVLVAVDARTALDSEAPVMVVTKVSDVVAEDEDTIKITGIVAGETVAVIVDPDEANDVDVEKGNVILYAESADYVTDVEVLFASTDEAPAADVTPGEDMVADFSDEYVSLHYGEAGESKSGYFYVGEDKFYFADDCNVTVVDYTGASVSIKAGRTSDVKSSTRTTKTIFVKTVAEIEDEVSDIVVFIED